MAAEKESKKEKTAVDLLKMISEYQPETQHEWNDNQFYLKPISKVETPKLENIVRIQSTNKQKKHYEIFKKRTQRKFQLFIPENSSKQPNYKSFSLSKLQKGYDVSNKDGKVQFRAQINKSNLNKYKEKDSNLIMPAKKQKNMNETISNYLRPSGSEGYILKINKFVSPQKLKQLNERSQHSDSSFQKNQIVKQGFKSKVRWKISNKFNNRKQSIQAQRKNTNRISSMGQEDNNYDNQNSGQIQGNKGNLLKNLLDSNRYRKRRSVASLLRSLFDSQARSKKEQSLKLAIRSARFVSLTSDNSKFVK